MHTNNLLCSDACGRMRFSGPVRTGTVGDSWSVGTGTNWYKSGVISSVALSKRGVKEDERRWKKLGETGLFAHVRAWEFGFRMHSDVFGRIALHWSIFCGTQRHVKAAIHIPLLLEVRTLTKALDSSWSLKRSREKHDSDTQDVAPCYLAYSNDSKILMFSALHFNGLIWQSRALTLLLCRTCCLIHACCSLGCEGSKCCTQNRGTGKAGMVTRCQGD